MAPLAPVLALVAALSSPAAASNRFLVCERRVDCSAPVADPVPANSLLVAFDERDLKGPHDWVIKEKSKVVAGLNQLLAAYGFPLRAAEIPAARLDALLERKDLDLAVKYRANSFLARVALDRASVNLAGTHIVAVDYFDRDMVIFGPTRSDDIELIEVKPVHQMADSTTPRSRRRAMLAWTLFHEFVHAAHHRLLGTLVSGSPAPNLSPPCLVPYDRAQDHTTKLLLGLQLGSVSGHMASGLMVAGGDRAGNPNDTKGVGMVYDCLKDPRVGAALIEDMAALSASDQLCGGTSDSPDGFPVGGYFELPNFNKAAIARHLSLMSRAGCYGGCYYRVMDERAAMKISGYDAARHYDPRAQLRGAKPETWWQFVNRECVASDSKDR